MAEPAGHPARPRFRTMNPMPSEEMGASTAGHPADMRFRAMDPMSSEELPKTTLRIGMPYKIWRWVRGHTILWEYRLIPGPAPGVPD